MKSFFPQRNEKYKFFYHPIFASFLIFCFVTLIIISADNFLPESLRQNTPSDYINHYLPLAKSLLNHGIYTLQGELDDLYPPGYPILIAIEIIVANFINIDLNTSQLLFSIIYMTGSAGVLFSIGKRTYGEKWWVWLITFVFLTYPFYIWIALGPNNETPFIFFFFSGIWFFIREKLKWLHCLLGGTLIGFSMLIRPIAIGLGLLIALYILVFRTEKFKIRILLAAVLLIGNLLTILPWEAFIYQQTGDIIPLSNSGVRGMRDGLTFAIRKLHYRDVPNVPENIITLMQSIDEAELLTISDYAGYLFSQFRQNPINVGMLFAIKATRSWYATDSGHLDNIILLVQIPYLLISTFSFYCAFHLGKKKLHLVSFVGIIVIYFWVMTILVLSIVRYMLPVMGLLFLLWPSIGIYLSQRVINSKVEVHQS